MKPVVLSDWLLERLDKNADEPMYRQLHRLMLKAVLDGQISAGSRLPSSRLLSREINVARNTVTEVYEYLKAEGCVQSKHGSGTYVMDLSVDRLIGKRSISLQKPHSNSVVPHVTPHLSRRGHILIEGAGFSSRQWGSFMPGVPDVTEFPARIWIKLHNKNWRRMSAERLSYAPAGGLHELRLALADYLGTARAVRCTPEQIVITTGSHQSVDLAARLLTDQGDPVWIEDPCYWGLRSTLTSLGLSIHAVPVDSNGINWNKHSKLPAPRLVIATPSHQYPLGMVMSLSRRQALLEYSRRHNSWIIEDDYDSEFRYGTRPIASLQGLDSSERVIYVGSFSKTLFPGLRIGYMVVPPSLAETFAKSSAELYREGQLQQQATLADFITQGHLTSHIRRMRILYGQRRQCLLEEVHQHFGNVIDVLGDNAGLHLVLRLPAAIDDSALAKDALNVGIVVRPLSRYYSILGDVQKGLLLGYACVKEEDIPTSFAILAKVLKKYGVKAA